MSSSFHVPIAGCKRSSTLCVGSATRDRIGLLDDCFGIQLSSQILVVWPLPILLITPCFNRSLPSSIARHTCDGWGPSSAMNMVPLGKYTTFRILALKGLGSCRILHVCLARSARLKISRSQNPIPPKYLGLVMTSQETQGGLLRPSLQPHQNFLIIEFKCSQRPLGSLK